MTDATLTSGERQRIWLYFLDTRLRYAFVALFLGLVFVGLSPGKVLLLFGLAWLGVALILETRRPSDREVDELFDRDLQSLVQNALRSLDPPPDAQPPLALYGPVERGAAPQSRFLVRPRAGKDSRLRSPVICAVILVPMDDQLGLYSCQHDCLEGLTSQVSVEEHHYRDVVTVRLEEDVAVSANKGRRPSTGPLRPTQVFSLELTNGRRLSVPVSAAWQGEQASGGGPQATALEKTAQAIRTLMRDKR